MTNKLTEEESKKIEAAFMIDATPKEVVLETGLGYEKVLEWMATGDNHKRMEELRTRPRWEAKKLVTKASGEDLKTAQWYLERKAKDEFSNRTELTGRDGKDLIPKPLLFNVRDNISLEEGNEAQK